MAAVLPRPPSDGPLRLLSIVRFKDNNAACKVVGCWTVHPYLEHIVARDGEAVRARLTQPYAQVAFFDGPKGTGTVCFLPVSDLWVTAPKATPRR